MRLSSRYFSVYVFAAFALGFSLMVGLHTEAATKGVARLAHDGQLIVADAQRISRKVSREFHYSPKAVVRLFVNTVAMPKMMFEKISQELDKVSRRA
ncbi:hypothetical protein [Roseibium litorale]|uniref:Uncharacterized protein n=1 Tax=Roseibium litorale TaxID=2803841 RepID=A0ABR9CQ34_9HYPH|nr:hypothetical protein [Roseibium litorale]MBD8892779.1 hypothetical protein [Roseibium litorale]